MDALGRSLAVLVAVVAIICVVPIASDSSDGAGEADGLLLYEVNPFSCEGVSVYNYGNSAIDLIDYHISDNPSIDPDVSSEGFISFTESIVVQPGEFVVIASEDGDSNFVTREGTDVRFIGSDGIVKTGRFVLSNSGDDVYLFRGDRIVDAVCYGNKIIDNPSLWASNDSFSTKNNVFFQRHGTYDSDSEEDWFNYIPGQTKYEFDPDYKIDATVTPFLFPDSGGIPAYDAISSAETSLYINVYIISSKNICGLILEKMEQNPDLDVDIIVEGTPVEGYVQNSESLVTLARDGADVRLIGTGDSPRFDQDHAKYAIIDMEKVVVTSENWTTDNMNGHVDDNVYSGTDDGNRGWGAVIESTEYAQFMYGVFQNDFSTQYGDVTPILEALPEANGESPYYEPVDKASFQSYRAQVTPILSNDNSYDYTEYFIDIAEERIYCEQQSLSSSYQTDHDDSPVTMMAKRAIDNVDARLIIGTGVTGYNEVELWINQTTAVSSATLTTPYVHNKGIVSDDVAVVSSVNWTPNSFFNNRECAVAIHSAEIADFFASAFLEDFDRCYDYDGISVDITEIESHYPAGQEVTFTVSVDPPGEYTYVWDFGDGSEKRTTSEPRVAHVPQLNGDTGGSFKLRVMVMDGQTIVGENSKTYSVGEISIPGYPATDEDDSETGSDGNLPDDGTNGDDSETVVEESGSDVVTLLSDYMYILAPLIVIILAIIGAVSRKGKKKRK